MNRKFKRVQYYTLNDNLRAPCSTGWESFSRLEKNCDSCYAGMERGWGRGGGATEKMTKFTASAFIVRTNYSIAAVDHLFQHHGFQYVLPALFSTNPLEEFFGTARQRVGGNFCIHVLDIISAAKADFLNSRVCLFLPKI